MPKRQHHMEKVGILCVNDLYGSYKAWTIIKKENVVIIKIFKEKSTITLRQAKEKLLRNFSLLDWLWGWETRYFLRTETTSLLYCFPVHSA